MKKGLIYALITAVVFTTLEPVSKLIADQVNPYAMTFIATLSNSWLGYIPSQLGYTNGGYSTDITKYAPGTGEKLVTEYLTLINSLHE